MNRQIDVRKSSRPQQAFPLRLSIESGRDLVSYFANQKLSAGEKVELFFAFSETSPRKAVPALASILETQASSTMRALALQGLGRAAQADLEIGRTLTACQTDEDIQIIKDVTEQVKGKGQVSNDLTRWAAAWALEEIGFPAYAIGHLEVGALSDPPERIRNEIVNRKLREIDKIQRVDRRGERTAEYERHLEFWLYGPTQELFRVKDNSPNYEAIVGDAISLLGVRGIELGLGAQNSSRIGEIALGVAEYRFSQFRDDEQERLYETLKLLLTNNYKNLLWKNLAGRVVSQAGPWLNPSARARALIIWCLCGERTKNIAARIIIIIKPQFAEKVCV